MKDLLGRSGLNCIVNGNAVYRIALFAPAPLVILIAPVVLSMPLLYIAIAIVSERIIEVLVILASTFSKQNIQQYMGEIFESAYCA